MIWSRKKKMRRDDVGKARFTVYLDDDTSWDMYFEGNVRVVPDMGWTFVTTAKQKFEDYIERCGKTGFSELPENRYVPMHRVREIVVDYEPLWVEHECVR